MQNIAYSEAASCIPYFLLKSVGAFNISSKMMKIGFAVVLLSLLAFGANQAGFLDCFKCPTSDDYSHECLEHVLPPWPICLSNDAEYFVEKAKDSVPRCCSDDLSECRCPKKDTPKFLDKIDDYCEGVQKCMPCKSGDCMTTGEMMAQKKQETDRLNHHDYSHIGTSESREGSCPTDETFSNKCLQSAIPPYPICLKASAKEWVEKALKGHDDCCGEDLSSCKCPKKDSAKFVGKIGDWCAGVETCASIDSVEPLGNLRTQAKLQAP